MPETEEDYDQIVTSVVETIDAKHMGLAIDINRVIRAKTGWNDFRLTCQIINAIESKINYE